MKQPTESAILSRNARIAVLIAAFLGLVFDGVELGLMPVATGSICRSLLGEELGAAQTGKWFANFGAALMLGAALGGIFLGSLGDRIGRTKALGISVLFYSVFAGLGAYAQSLEQMLILRFMVGLGVGGVWPNGVALVAECWPNASRPAVSGVMGAGINVGIIALSQMGEWRPITADDWRWIFQVVSSSSILGIVILTTLPESPKWLASRDHRTKLPPPLRSLLHGELLRATIIGILLASVPLVGAWAGSKWMIPWAEKVAISIPGYKSRAQRWWAIGATLGSFLGAPFAAWIGRRLSYFLISLGATSLTLVMFKLTAPLEPVFLYVVFAQGFVATLFFGWLPLFLPELFPTHARATGVGVAMNTGRFVTAAAVYGAGGLFTWFGNDYTAVGAACAFIYALGMILVFWTPRTDDATL
jgi:predicted MFS family arabinose efflux permease